MRAIAVAVALGDVVWPIAGSPLRLLSARPMKSEWLAETPPAALVQPASAVATAVSKAGCTIMPPAAEAAAMFTGGNGPVIPPTAAIPAINVETSREAVVSAADKAAYRICGDFSKAIVTAPVNVAGVVGRVAAIAVAPAAPPAEGVSVITVTASMVRCNQAAS